MTDHLVTQWRTWQYAQSLSQRTVKERIRILGHFGQWLDHSPATASLDEIVEYLAVGEWAPSTRATYYSVLRAWFLWLQRLEHRPDNPMLHVSPPRVPRRQPHPVSSHGLVRVLGTHMHRRTRVMILLYCLGGIRCAEIARFRGEWVDIEARTMTVLGKGGVTATLPMHPLLVEVAQTMPREGWWFPTNASRPEGGHVRGKSVGRIIKNVFVRAGVQGSAHSLRHWFGTSLVENDVDLRTTQELMRHASLATTQLYTLVSDQRKARGVERLDPWRSSSEGTAA